MKRIAILGLLAILLGGCVATPVGYGYREGYNDHHYRYDRGYGYGYGYGDHERERGG